MCIGLPIIESSFENAIASAKQVPYEIYSIQQRNFQENKQLYNSTLYKTSQTDENENRFFVIKADVQNENPEWPAYKKYFMHGTSHHMGLDTHDYGVLTEPMQANMIFTVEPGIYIPDEGFGIRLEDDVIIQKGGEPFNLMRNIPIEVDEIENIMNS